MIESTEEFQITLTAASSTIVTSTCSFKLTLTDPCGDTLRNWIDPPNDGYQFLDYTVGDETLVQQIETSTAYLGMCGAVIVKLRDGYDTEVVSISPESDSQFLVYTIDSAKEGTQT